MYPIKEPDKIYSLRRLIGTRDAYREMRDRLNLFGLMEYYFLNGIMDEEIKFIRGTRRGKAEMRRVSFRKAYRFAFSETAPKDIKPILTNTGKIIYSAEGSPIAIIIDIGGDYFRILDTSLKPVIANSKVLSYISPEEKETQFKGPYLDHCFHRVFLKRHPKRRSGYCLTPAGYYAQMTHFRIKGRHPFPMQYVNGKESLTLSEIYDILKEKLGIEDMQVCLNKVDTPHT